MSREMVAQRQAFRQMQNAFTALQSSNRGEGLLVFSEGPAKLLGIQLPVNKAKDVAEIERKLSQNRELQAKVVSTLGNVQSSLRSILH